MQCFTVPVLPQFYQTSLLKWSPGLAVSAKLINTGWLVRVASAETGGHQALLQGMHLKQVTRKPCSIRGCSDHPLHKEFQLLVPAHCFRIPHTKTRRARDSFVPVALNKPIPLHNNGLILLDTGTSHITSHIVIGRSHSFRSYLFLVMHYYTRCFMCSLKLYFYPCRKYNLP